MSVSFKSVASLALTGSGPVGMAANLLGLGGLVGRLKPPSEARAAVALGKILARVAQGDLVATRAILFRATVGIARERAVWVAAAASIPAQQRNRANAQAAALDALVDHSNPESVARTVLAAPMVSGGGTATGAAFGAAGGSAFAMPFVNLTGDGGGATAAPGRAKKGRTHVRYNPQTGKRTLVPIGSEEDLTWSNRKPRARSPITGAPTSKAVAREQSRLRTQSERSISAAAAKRLAAYGAPGAFAAAAKAGGVSSAGLAAAYLGAAGLAAYAATKLILDGLAAGETARNLTAAAVSIAHTRVRKQLGREVTRTEYADLRARVIGSLTTAIRSGMGGSIERGIRAAITLIKGS